MNSATSFYWGPDAVALLQRRVDEGATASQIAAELGEGVTRSAVLGKCNRMKLQLRGGAGAAGNQTLALRATAIARTVQAKTVAPPLPRPATMASLVLMRPSANASPADAAAKAESYLNSAERRVAFDPARAPAGARLVKLVDLDKGDCRWPLYEGGPMLFCGAWVRTVDRDGQPHPYCEHHLAMSLPRKVPS